MVALTLIFVVLYAAALLGWLKPLSDVTIVTRLEPIIFVIIGYYFGRLPAQHNEKTLKEEINRQTQKADAAHQAKVQVHLERESLEEKIKNAKAVLTSPSPHARRRFSIEEESTFEKPKSEESGSSPPNQLITVAIGILDS